MEKKKINQEDLCRWLAGTLDDHDKLRIIEEDVQKGDESRVRQWCERIADQAERFANMRSSGELARRVASWSFQDEPNHSEDWQKRMQDRPPEDLGRG